MTKGQRQLALMGEKPRCLQCEGIELRRQGRIGFLQRVLLPKLGVFPWECGLCRKIYLLPQRSTGYRQHSSKSTVPPAPAHRELVPVAVVVHQALKPLAQKQTVL